MTDDPIDLTLGGAEIGELFRPPLSARQIQHLATTGELPVFKFNGKLATTKKAVEAYIARRITEALASVPTLATERTAVAEEPRTAAPLKQRSPTRRNRPKPAKRRGGDNAPAP